MNMKLRVFINVVIIASGARLFNKTGISVTNGTWMTTFASQIRYDAKWVPSWSVNI